MEINNIKIGGENRVFIVAELSANHNGDLDVAKESIRAAKRAGADAIKLQTYTANTITLDVKTDDFLLNQGTIWDGNYLFDLYAQASTPWEWHEELFAVAKEEGIACFSSPFDTTAVDFLESLNTPAYKIASFEITDIPLIEYVASKNKPVIISTGIAKEEDITLALDTCRRMGNENVALLKCTSSYPAPINQANLIMVKELANRFGVISGLSDHTIGNTSPIVATCFGAKIIEKHFILNKSIGGADSSFSMDENDFSDMVRAIREAESSIGKINFDLFDDQLKAREFCRSLYVVKDIKKGEIFTRDNVRSIRPGYGLHPKYYKDLLGKPAIENLSKGSKILKSYL
jgi:pseudaminic acid synthase